MRIQRQWGWIAELILLLLFALLPLHFGLQPYTMGLLTLLLINTILLIGLDITVGYLGQVNLGQTAFLAIGAYAAALASGWGAGMFISLGIAYALTFLLGACLAVPALRLYGPQFALATLSFSTLTVIILNEWEGLTNGAQGLSLDRPILLGMHVTPLGFYWICLTVVTLCWIGMRNLLSSQWGRAFQALRDSVIATDSVGIGAMRHKILALAIGSGLGGLAGGLYAFNFEYLQPQSFSFDLMVLLLLGVVLGGRQSLWGALLGAALVTLLPNLLSNPKIFQALALTGFLAAVAALLLRLKQRKPLNFIIVAPFIALTALFLGSLVITNPEDWRKGIFAVILFSTIVGLPEGLIGFIEKFLKGRLKLTSVPFPEPCPLDQALPPVNVKGSLLQVEHLKRYFGGVKAVDDVSFQMKPDEILGIIGPNGSGKSTLINLISGFYRPSHGKMVFEGESLPEGSLLKVSRKGIARTFQNLQLFTQMTVIENVMAALRGVYKKSWLMIMAGLSKDEEKEAEARALAILQFVGLEPQARLKAKNLPYGQQRVLEIARALATEPQLLILDEPAAGMAKPDAENLKRLIVNIRQRGIGVILIEHRMDMITELCDEVIVLQSGQLIAQGPPQEVKNNPKVIEAYLGEQKQEIATKPSKMTYSEPFLSVQKIQAGYGLGDILNDLSLEVKKGQIAVMIGANGVGKTTAMRVISGLLPSTSGHVFLGSQEITNKPASFIVRQGLSHTPEGRGIFSELSVEDNLLLGAYIHLPKFFGFTHAASQDLAKSYKLFPQLYTYRHRLAGTLSGGEQQMLAIARSLMSKPQILLLDEPSMGLAPLIIDNVFKTIQELNREGISILLVEQFASRALSVADVAYVIQHGQVVLQGSPQELIKDPKILTAYLGE